MELAMERFRVTYILVILVAAKTIESFLVNGTLKELPEVFANETRRSEYRGTEKRKKSERSTSSSSGEKKGNDDKSAKDAESLELSTSGLSDESDKKRKKHKYVPKSSAERKGWKKWHRKCPPCPQDMVLKWRDPKINWVCGAYQRARRTFKSTCMMRYRNCQDGTMFVKIHDYRCEDDDPKNPRPHGDHFFYDYKAKLSDETSSNENSDGSSDDEESGSESTSSEIKVRRQASKMLRSNVSDTGSETELSVDIQTSETDDKEEGIETVVSTSNNVTEKSITEKIK